MGNELDQQRYDTHVRGDIVEPKDTDYFSLIELVNTILKYRRLLILTPLIVLILVVGYTFIRPRKYSTSPAFLPQSSSHQGSLTSSLAAQFGLSISTSELGQSPQFYANLITSRQILKELTRGVYSFKDGDKIEQSTLSKLLRIEEGTEELTREKAILILEELISVTIERETGLVTFTVETKWPEVSAELAQNILEQVNQFNLETRQTQASAERVFIEGRLSEVEAELRASEDSLQDFLQKNRQWQGSHELEFIHDRLIREVAMRQQVFTTLNQAYEQARIDEVRDTPVITIVESPEVPVLPDRRRLLLKGILALMVGIMLGIFGAFGREFMIRGHKQEANNFAEFEKLKQETWQDIKNPWRLLRS